MQGEERDVLITTDLPAIATPSPTYPVFHTSLRYTSIYEEQSEEGVDTSDTSGTSDTRDTNTSYPANKKETIFKGGKLKNPILSLIYHIYVPYLSPIPYPSPSSIIYPFIGDDCTIIRTDGPEKVGVDEPVRNLQVDLQMNRALFAHATQACLAAADARNFTLARKELNEALTAVQCSPSVVSGHIKSKALVTELERTMLNCQDETYTKGGRSTMTETSQTWNQQRKVYTKTNVGGVFESVGGDVTSFFQSKSSAGMQKKGAMSKTSR